MSYAEPRRLGPRPWSEDASEALNSPGAPGPAGRLQLPADPRRAQLPEAPPRPDHIRRSCRPRPDDRVVAAPPHQDIAERSCVAWAIRSSPKHVSLRIAYPGGRNDTRLGGRPEASCPASLPSTPRMTTADARRRHRSEGARTRDEAGREGGVPSDRRRPTHTRPRVRPSPSVGACDRPASAFATSTPPTRRVEIGPVRLAPLRDDWPRLPPRRGRVVRCRADSCRTHLGGSIAPPARGPGDPAVGRLGKGPRHPRPRLGGLSNRRRCPGNAAGGAR